MRLHGHFNKGKLAEGLEDLPDIISGKVVEKITDVESVIRNGGIGVPFLPQNGGRSGQAGKNSWRQRARARKAESDRKYRLVHQNTDPIDGAPGMVGRSVFVIFFSDSLNAIIIGRPITMVPDNLKA